MLFFRLKFENNHLEQYCSNYCEGESRLEELFGTQQDNIRKFLEKKAERKWRFGKKLELLKQLKKAYHRKGLYRITADWINILLARESTIEKLNQWYIECADPVQLDSAEIKKIASEKMLIFSLAILKKLNNSGEHTDAYILGAGLIGVLTKPSRIRNEEFINLLKKAFKSCFWEPLDCEKKEKRADGRNPYSREAILKEANEIERWAKPSNEFPANHLRDSVFSLPWCVLLQP